MPEKLVVDANFVISCLVNKGVCLSTFVLNSIEERFELIAPEFLLEELKGNKPKALQLTRMSEEEFTEVYEWIFDEIALIPASEFVKFWPAAKASCRHLKDVPYVALALAASAPILSGDKGLPKTCKVLSPREFLDLLTK